MASLEQIKTLITRDGGVLRIQKKICIKVLYLTKIGVTYHLKNRAHRAEIITWNVGRSLEDSGQAISSYVTFYMKLSEIKGLVSRLYYNISKYWENIQIILDLYFMLIKCLD